MLEQKMADDCVRREAIIGAFGLQESNLGQEGNDY